MPRRQPRGFTLNEVLIALVLVGIIGAAFTKLLASQSRYFDKMTNLRAARSVARASTNVLFYDLRMVQDSGGIDSASSDGKTIRVIVPYRFGLVCGTNSNTTIVMMLPIDSATDAMSQYAGFAYRNSTGASAGRYTIITPPEPKDDDKPANSSSASTCTGSSSGQQQLRTVTLNGRSSTVLDLKNNAPSGAPALAPAFMWEHVTYSFKASSSYPGYYGLYRNVQGGTNEELLAPFDSTARFRFFVAGDDTSRTTVPALSDIRGIALVLDALSPKTVSNDATTHSPSRIVTSVFFKNVRSY
ncbi:MAG TPA: type II secretion system protein [Gemmatimonadaceae bacterium]|nr:type II secretion system protein [Gemmatimonadaceae bacterium]